MTHDETTQAAEAKFPTAGRRRTEYEHISEFDLQKEKQRAFIAGYNECLKRHAEKAGQFDESAARDEVQDIVDSLHARIGPFFNVNHYEELCLEAERRSHTRTAAGYEARIADLEAELTESKRGHEVCKQANLAWLKELNEALDQIAKLNGMANLDSADPFYKIRESEYDALVKDRDAALAKVAELEKKKDE